MGKPMSEDHKRKISEALKGNKHTLGKTHTEETKLKIKSGVKAYWDSENGQTDARRREVVEEPKVSSGPWNKGKKFSEEHRQKLSESHKGQVGYWKGKPGTRLGEANSPEHNEAISKSMKAHWANPEFRSKVTEALKEAWQRPNRTQRIVNFMKVVNSYPYKSGYHVSHKAGKVHYRSSYELAFFQQLDREVDVKTYEVETLQVKYKFNNQSRVYIPDVVIYYTDGSKEVVEIKPEGLLEAPENQAKFDAAIRVFGEQFCIVTEQELF